MKESLAALATVMVVLAGIPVGAAGLAVTADVVTDASPSQNGQAMANASSNESLSPGAHFSGVVGRQQADIEGEVEVRAFGLAVAGAASNQSKAAVVASQLDRIRGRLAQLDGRLEDLRAAYRNGSLDRGAYAAQATAVVTRIQSVERLANKSARVSRWLPAEALAARGIDPSEIDALQRDARTIAGANVSRIARSIGGVGDNGFTPPGLRGEDRGRPWDGSVPGLDGTGPPGPPDGTDPPGPPDGTDPVENATDDLGNGSDGVDDAVDNATDGVENTTDEVGDAVENTTDSADNVADSVDDAVANTTDPVDDVTGVIKNGTDRLENETGNGTGVLGSRGDFF